MSRVCELCGKKPQKGHKVSHSNIKTRTFWWPNLSIKKLVLDGVLKKVKLCNVCLKTYIKKTAGK